MSSTTGASKTLTNASAAVSLAISLTSLVPSLYKGAAWLVAKVKGKS